MRRAAILSILLSLCVAAQAAESDTNNFIPAFLRAKERKKCPGICRYGKDTKLVKKECKKRRSTCSAKYQKCVIADCTKREGGKIHLGKKCVCPDCPNKCYTNPNGYEMATAECASGPECHRLGIPNDKCFVQTCKEGNNIGFKCACKPFQAGPSGCPKYCHTGQLSDLLARTDCNDAFMQTCADSGSRCRVKDCEVGGVRGKECGCPDAERACPETCYTGPTSETLAFEDCLGDKTCVSGSCLVRDCWIGLTRGKKCGCRDEPPPRKCPNKCRFSPKGRKKVVKECREALSCPDGGKCEVRDCYDRNGFEGIMCGCMDPTPFPKPCPNQCHVGTNARPRAESECEIPRKCDIDDNDCKVRDCWIQGFQGYKCGCTDEDPPIQPCPNVCHVGQGFMEKARTDCKGEHTCPLAGAKCAVRDCWDVDGRKGAKCACMDEVEPAGPCPEICNAMAVTPQECPDNVQCDATNPCGIKSCYVVDTRSSTGFSEGWKCGCEDETHPMVTCDQECQFDDADPTGMTAEQRANEKCFGDPTPAMGAEVLDFLTCRQGTCRVRDCYNQTTGEAGKKCACKDGLPFVSRKCPGVCRMGRSGKRTATNECSLNPQCLATREPCQVQRCPLGRKKGWECGCK